jgi:hypothetical protein
VYWGCAAWPAWPVWTVRARTATSMQAGDRHTANLDGAMAACQHSAGSSCTGIHHTAGSTWQLVMRFSRMGDTALGPVRWVLDGRGETTLHTERGVRGVC